MKIQRLLLTGAAGQLGRGLRERLRGICPILRLSDIAEMPPAQAGEEVLRCDLADAEAVRALLHEVDAVVHLGGQAVEAPWETILRCNIHGAINLWEAARLAGTKRILFASSNHAIGFYHRADRIHHVVPARPDTRYGLSKVFGEELAKLYAFKYGISALCMRIGSCFPKPTTQRMLSSWLSLADLERLVRVGLKADYLFEVVYGSSNNPQSWWDNSNAERLGYRPQDTAEDFREAVEQLGESDPRAAPFQGGPFAADEFVGPAERVPRYIKP